MRHAAVTPGSPDAARRPADEREPKAAVVERERAGREDRVEELAAAVEEAGGVPPSRPVVEVELDLLDREARPEERRSSSAPRSRTRGEREAGGAGPSAQEPLARQRLARRLARPQADERAADALGDPEAPADPATERRDREVGVATRRAGAATRAGRRRQRSSGPGGAARSPAESASPFPSRSSAEHRRRRPPPRARRCGPRSRRRRRSPRRRESRAAARRPSRRSAPPRSAPRRGW